MTRGLFELLIMCDNPECRAKRYWESFYGRDKQSCIDQAREAGWSHGLELDYCPTCAEEKWGAKP